MEKIQLPQQVTELMSLLRSHCYESLVVGDAARELLMGNNPMDYDIITNCEMDRLLVIFDNYRLKEDNVDCGELIVMVRGMVIMVSPYRKGFDDDGKPIYASLPIHDLARRDFTMNAVGITIDGDLYDPFNGAACLESEPYIVKAVTPRSHTGDEIRSLSSVAASPAVLMNALALAATGDYVIHNETAAEIKACADIVNDLPPKQLRDAFEQILMAKRCGDIMVEFKEVIFAIFPELAQTDEFDQHSENHAMTLYRHTCKSAFLAPPDLTLRYALFFHGAGKPDCEAIYADGHASFYGHGERAVILAKRALKRLKAPTEQIEEILFLIRHHDLAETLKTEEIDRLLEYITPVRLKKLLLAGYANLRAKKPEYEQKAAAMKRLSEQVLHWNEPTNNKFRAFI